MSGNYFDGLQWYIEAAADQIDRIIAQNSSTDLTNVFGEIINGKYSAKTVAEFTKAVAVLRDAQAYIHRIDYLLEGDDSEEEFHEQLQNDLQELKK